MIFVCILIIPEFLKVTLLSRNTETSIDSNKVSIKTEKNRFANNVVTLLDLDCLQKYLQGLVSFPYITKMVSV